MDGEERSAAAGLELVFERSQHGELGAQSTEDVGVDDRVDSPVRNGSVAPDATTSAARSSTCSRRARRLADCSAAIGRSVPTTLQPVVWTR